VRHEARQAPGARLEQFDQPRAAVAIVVESGESGGQTVAPMVREVMVSIFGEAPPAEAGEAAAEASPAPAAAEGSD
jgi:hypothetical protein